MRKQGNNGHKPHQGHKPAYRRVVMLDGELLDAIDPLADADDLTREGWLNRELWKSVKRLRKVLPLTTR